MREVEEETVRFDELVLKIPGDELRVRFHARLTILSGLNPEERQALAGSIVGALIGGDDVSSLRYLDGTGRTVILTSRDGGPAMARHDDDGSPARPPLAALGPSAAAARSLVVVGANDLGVPVRPARDDEPAELLEACASLAEITEELEAARGLADAVAALRAELAEVDAQIRHVHDHAAQREYAKVLARLERVRAEAATLRSGRAGIDADRHLLAGAATVEDLSQRWSEAAEALAETRAAFGPERRVPSNELKAAAEAPDEVPTELPALVETLAGAERHHAELDHRLQVLSVAKLPAPSDLAVGELGLLDQGSLWAAADRLLAAREDVHRVQVSLGGLGGEDGDAGPAVIVEMEAAHRALDDAERAAESVRIPGVAGTALGATLTLAGTISGPLLIPLGLLIAGVVGTVTLLLPRSRVAKAAAVERVALDRAGAPTYLGFHLRRVDATVDPHLRSEVEAVTAGHRAAVVAWSELVGPELDVSRAKELEVEVRGYHDALRSLGGAADEIEHLRRELAESAGPAVVAARAAVASAVEPFDLGADDLVDPDAVLDLVADRVHRGQVARRQIDLEAAEAAAEELADRLGQQLRQLGFDAGEIEARVGALAWAVGRAQEREEARANARPSAEIEAELTELEGVAAGLRQPEWSEVTAADASEPDLTDLEERRAHLVQRASEPVGEVDVPRLGDRQAALARRVTALELRYGGDDVSGDPGALADIQQHLLAHLTKAAQAGPQGDPVPVVLDEVFQRVPAEHKWDLLDLLFRLSERHQLVYLSDDPFVAAWARQCADGSVLLLEPEPETV